MSQTLRNKRGFADVLVIIPMIVVMGVVAQFLVATSVKVEPWSISIGIDKDAAVTKLKKDGNIIWCKMKNIDADTCDALYE